jgi:hypothetical protein
MMVAQAHIASSASPNGVAAIEVPADAAVFDPYEEHLMHFHRSGMRDKVHLLYPLFWLAKKANQRCNQADTAKREASVRAAISTGGAGGGLNPWLMQLEDLLHRRSYLPFGAAWSSRQSFDRRASGRCFVSLHHGQEAAKHSIAG